MTLEWYLMFAAGMIAGAAVPLLLLVVALYWLDKGNNMFKGLMKGFMRR